MRDVTPEDWRQQVGRHVEDRRRLLFPSRRAAASSSGVSEIVWRQVESGRRQIAPGTVIAPNPEQQTKVSISRRLQWEPDAIDRLLAGQPPVDAPADDDGSSSDGNGHRPDLEQRVSAIEDRLATTEAKVDLILQGLRDSAREGAR